MKRIAAIFLLVVVVGVVGCLGVEASRILADRRQTGRVRATLPSVELVDSDGAPADVAASSDQSTVLVFFTTTCTYCRAEVAEIRRNAAPFAGTDVVFISPEDRKAVRTFRREAGLHLFPQFRVLRDTVPTLGALFRIRRVPTVLVYGPSGQLTGEFEGLTPIDRILDAAEVPQ